MRKTSAMDQAQGNPVGPGQYEVSKQIGNSGFGKVKNKGFGSSGHTGFGQKKDKVPGPGAYTTISKDNNAYN